MTEPTHIWCPECNEITELKLDKLPKDKFVLYVDAIDLMCKHGHVLATTYRKLNDI